EHNLLQLSLQEQEQLKTLPLLKLPPQYKTKSLPIEVDNSLLPYYPGLFLQSGLSCGQVAAVSIGLTYELCRLRNLDGTDIANNYPSHFAWNWENGGQGYYGASYYHSFELMRLVGIPTTEVYGGSFDHGGSNRWMTGYDAYYNAMQNRIHKAWAIKLDTEEGILTLKNWLNDHLDGSEDGGVAFFYANYKGRDGVLPASSAHAGEGVITNWGGTSHAYTIVGYSDEVKWDFNGDGQYTNHIDINGDGIVDVRDWEIGAFKVINNYSTPYHAWAPYKTFAGDGISPSSGAWNYTANVIEAKAETNPQLTYKINLYYSKRGRIKIRTGMSTNIYANQPEHIIEFPIINNQGSDVGMLGTNEDADRYMEFGLDVSPFLNFIEPGTQAKFFFEIIETDPEQWGSGRVISFSLMDYTNGLSETICEQSDVHITNNTTTQLSIVANINYEQVNIITEELPNADIYEDYEFQLEAEGGTEPYIWELDTDYNITSSTAVMPNDITSSFSGSYIDLPFTFNFYGKPYTRIYISNQGHIDFSGSSYNTPYSHELLSSFMTFPCIAACLTSQYSFSTYLKVEDDYVAVRWTHANFI
ncbi:MAG: hypothetical protein GX879_10655, partial [Bacteroidales bacterium]|nr:hypothetical protein [Bacteroidales bacterium]